MEIISIAVFVFGFFIVSQPARGSEFAWEENDLEDLFESDIKLEIEQVLALEETGDIDGSLGTKRGIAKDKNKLWPNGVVPYVIDNDLSNTKEAMDAIREAFEEWQSQTCIQFVPRTNESDYVNFFGDGGGCWSYVGRVGGKQNISLASGCWQRGTITHEIAHALGFWHEQSRPDRDDYVEILWSNIPEEKKHNFRKYNRSKIDSLGSAYDYISVMHYSSTAFGGGSMTIRPKDPNASQLGQRVGLTPNDVDQADQLYGCQGRTTITTPAPPSPPPPPSGPYDCTFEAGTCGYINLDGDDFDWSLRIGGTPSRNTGPSTDHTRTPNYRLGHFVYIETSSPRKENDIALYQSPEYPAFGEKCFSFYYHMYGADMGKLNVNMQNDAGVTLVWSKEGDQSNQWHLAQIQIQAAKSFQIIFEGIRGSGYRGDVAIDDLHFVDGQCSIIAK